MNPYEAKQEARRERLEARAERLRGEASHAFKRADLSEAATGIPFGQPILVGHHSERRHRRVIERANKALDKAIDLQKAAGEAAARAASVGEGGISSDDPDAVAKLREKLATEEETQAQRKALNPIIRAFYKAGVRDEAAGDLWVRYMEKLCGVMPGASEALGRKLLEPILGHGVGVPAYDLSNRAANIRRIKDRIAHLERAAQRPHVEREATGGLRIVENVEANRLQMFFPGKPPREIIAELKSRGFRWAPSEGAWQRHLSNSAKWAAECVEKVWKEAA